MMAEAVILKARNAEVAAEMEQINRVDISRNGYEGESLWGFGHHHSSAHVCSFKNDPDVCGLIMDRAATIIRSDDMLPATDVVAGADGIHGIFAGNALRAKAKEMNANSIELVDNAAVFGLRVRQEACGDLEERAVECEAGFDGSLGAEGLERGRSPFKRNGRSLRWDEILLCGGR